MDVKNNTSFLGAYRQVKKMSNIFSKNKNITSLEIHNTAKSSYILMQGAELYRKPRLETLEGKGATVKQACKNLLKN